MWGVGNGRRDQKKLHGKGLRWTVMMARALTNRGAFLKEKQWAKTKKGTTEWHTQAGEDAERERRYGRLMKA